jgi:hypothetical protein
MINPFRIDLTTLYFFICTLESFRVIGISLLQPIHTLLLHHDFSLISINGFLVVVSFTHKFLSPWLLKPSWLHQDSYLNIIHPLTFDHLVKYSCHNTLSLSTLLIFNQISNPLTCYENPSLHTSMVYIPCIPLLMLYHET